MYMHFSDELVEEIRINNDIIDIVSQYVKLDKKGKYFFGLCPFHNEKTASFSVTPSKQIFYCYSCGKGGNVIQFIMNVEGLSYIDTLRFLANRARIDLPESDDKDEQEAARHRKQIIEINKEAARFFYQMLNDKKGGHAREYLQKRKVSGQVQVRFGLGFSPNEKDSLHRYLLGKEFEVEDILRSGLVVPDKKEGYRDRFRGRVMFPIFSVTGQLIGFGGRVLDSSMPKYVNSPETLVYSKGKNLYALNFAKNHCKKQLVVVEGYMDAISLSQYGIQNSVASLGTALTEGQAKILKKYTEEVIVSFDADTAGQAATLRGLDVLDKAGCSVRVLEIPQAKDPDEFLKINGGDGFKKLINNSLPLVEYKIKTLKSNTDSRDTNQKIEFLNKTAELIAKIDNDIEKEIYIKKIAGEYEISEQSLKSEIKKKTDSKFGPNTDKVLLSTSVKRTGSPIVAQNAKIIYYERLALVLLCEENGIYEAVKDKIDAEWFIDEKNREIATAVLGRLQSNKGILTVELLSMLESDLADAFVKIIQQECNFENNIKALLDIIKKIEDYRTDIRQKQILEELDNPGNYDAIHIGKLQDEIKAILLKKKSF